MTNNCEQNFFAKKTVISRGREQIIIFRQYEGPMCTNMSQILLRVCVITKIGQLNEKKIKWISTLGSNALQFL